MSELQQLQLPEKNSTSESDIVLFTADKLKAQSDQMLQDFHEMIRTETADLEDMCVKSQKLMAIFEGETTEYTDEI